MPLQARVINFCIIIIIIIIIIILWPTSTKPQALILRKSNNGCNGCSFGRHGVLKRDRIIIIIVIIIIVRLMS